MDLNSYKLLWNKDCPIWWRYIFEVLKLWIPYLAKVLYFVSFFFFFSPLLKVILSWLVLAYFCYFCDSLKAILFKLLIILKWTSLTISLETICRSFTPLTVKVVKLLMKFGRGIKRLNKHFMCLHSPGRLKCLACCFFGIAYSWGC